MDLDHGALIRIMLVGDPYVCQESFTKQYGDGESLLWDNAGFLHNRSRVTHVKLPVSTSPILPEGHGASQYQHRQQHDSASASSIQPNMVEMNVAFQMNDGWVLGHRISPTMMEFYQAVDAVIIFYDHYSIQSLHDVVHKWFPMVLHFCSNPPIFLLGCERPGKELVFGPMWYTVSPEQAKEVARQIRAIDVFDYQAHGTTSRDKIRAIRWTVMWYGYYHHCVKHHAQGRSNGLLPGLRTLRNKT